MNGILSPIATAPNALHNWVSGRIADFVVGTTPAQLIGNVVGKLCGTGIRCLIAGIAIPSAAYCGFALTAAMLVGLTVATRRRGGVLAQERAALRERPSIISGMGARIPSHAARQWFATATGRRFSRQLQGWIVKVGMVAAIALLSGTGIEMKHGIMLAAAPIVAYASAKS